MRIVSQLVKQAHVSDAQYNIAELPSSNLSFRSFTSLRLPSRAISQTVSFEQPAF